MTPIIRAIMENLVGVEDAAKIDIIANDVEYLEDGGWTIAFRHPESGFGHDKSKSTGPYRDLAHRPTLFFCGDGGMMLFKILCQFRTTLADALSALSLVSDLSAARAADLLFVKVIPGHTNDLSVHCVREGIPFVAFEQFLQVKSTVEQVVLGHQSIDSILQQ